MRRWVANQHQMHLRPQQRNLRQPVRQTQWLPRRRVHRRQAEVTTRQCLDPTRSQDQEEVE